MKPLTHNGMHTIRPTGPSARAVPLGIAFLLGFALLLAASLLVAPPIALSAERYTVPGSQVAIYDLAGEIKVEPYAGSDVVVEVTRGGRDAPELRIESGLRGARQTLRVIYPGKRVVYPKLGLGSRTNLRVRADGTFGDGLKDLLGLGTGVTISGRGNGLEAHADLRVAIPAGRRVAVYLAVGRVFVSNVDGDLQVDVSAANVTADHTKGSLRIGTGSGDVKVADAEGDVTLDTGSGNVIVAGAHGRQLKLDTGSGDVSAERVEVDVLKVDTGSGNVTASGVKSPDANIDTGSGNVRLELLADIESLYVDTGSGDVTLTLPPQFGAHVDIETGSGGIELRGVSIQTTRLERDHLVGDIGDGKGRMKIETGSGGITLQRNGQ